MIKTADLLSNQTQDFDLHLIERINMSQKFYVLCGEDALTFSSLCLGGDGAITTVGYSIGKGLHEMMQAFARGDSKAAQDIHRAIATAGRAQLCHACRPTPGLPGRRLSA